MQKTKRKSGIELLRIICMLSIIVLHVYSYGGVHDLSVENGGMFETVSNLVWTFFRTPVNVFVIITGYFMSKSSLDFKKSYKRLPKVYFTMLFYSVFIVLFALIVYNNGGFILAGNEADYTKTLVNLNNYSSEMLSGKTLICTIIKMFFPVMSSQWYFLTNYIIILLLSPFINYVLNALDKKQFKLLLAILFVFLSILPTLSSMDALDGIFSTHKVVPIEHGKSLISFLFMYIIGAYLKLFVKDDEKIHFKYLIYFIVFSLIDFSIYSLCDIFKQFGDDTIYNSSVFGQFSNPFVILASVFIFLFFRGFQFKSKIINYIAGTTIGIYAIHEHPLLRGYIWSHNNFANPDLYSEPWGFPMMLLMVFEIFAVCSLIDIVRQGVFNVVKLMYVRIRGKNQK